MIHLFTAIEFPPRGSGRQSFKNRKETAIYERRNNKQYNTIQKHRLHKIENKITKQENKHKKNIQKHVE